MSEAGDRKELHWLRDMREAVEISQELAVIDSVDLIFVAAAIAKCDNYCRSLQLWTWLT